MRSPLTRRRQNVVALVFLALFIVMAAWRGFDAALDGAILFIVLVFGFGHTVYLAVVHRRAAARRVTLEAERLVQRNSSERVVATIDLTAPFASECVYQDVDWVLYKVSQGRTTMWMSIPSDADGAPVRAVGLTWPPRAPSGLGYL
jgi:hypothetical protein